MSETLIPQTKKPRAPTYAIALLPFVLVLLVSIIAHVRAAISPTNSASPESAADAGRDATAPR